jgi:hypothetical protein
MCCWTTTSGQTALLPPAPDLGSPGFPPATCGRLATEGYRSPSFLSFLIIFIWFYQHFLDPILFGPRFLLGHVFSMDVRSISEEVSWSNCKVLEAPFLFGTVSWHRKLSALFFLSQGASASIL